MDFNILMLGLSTKVVYINLVTQESPDSVAA